MLKTLANFILRTTGWRVEVDMPSEKKFVIIGAPHTTNWDLPLALLCFWSIEQRFNWVAKKQLFVGPLNALFRSLGGIPVDRSASNGFIEQAAARFQQQDKLILAIAPEGTRSKTRFWKSGFYYIALAANVPICFGYIDFPSRTLGFKELLHPSGDLEKDFIKIEQYYSSKTGKFPEKQGPIEIKPRPQSSRHP